MKVLVAGLFWAALFSASAGPALQGLERVSISGEDYIRASDWADEVGLTLNWHRAKETLEITGASHTISLETDAHFARKAEIDGVPVWLSLPVTQRNGVPMISLADVQTTFHPLLAPPRARGRIQTICLDPGHGGRDVGESEGKNYEKKYNLLMAEALQRVLEADGFKVVLTRHGDSYVDLGERPAIAQRANADLFVSLHYNSAARPISGVEVHCLPPAGMNSSNDGGGRGSDPAYPGNAQNSENFLLAFHVLKSISDSLPLDIIGVKRQHYAVLREARMPAILIEGGFMTDPDDARRIYDPEFRERMAKAIAGGILAYKKAVEVDVAQARLPEPKAPAAEH